MEQPEVFVPCGGPGLRKLPCTWKLLCGVTAACLRHVPPTRWLLEMGTSVLFVLCCCVWNDTMLFRLEGTWEGSVFWYETRCDPCPSPPCHLCMKRAWPGNQPGDTGGGSPFSKGQQSVLMDLAMKTHHHRAMNTHIAWPVSTHLAVHSVLYIAF